MSTASTPTKYTVTKNTNCMIISISSTNIHHLLDIILANQEYEMYGNLKFKKMINIFALIT